MNKTRVVFMGTPDFAVPSLNALVKSGYDVFVVTQPDKPVGRKRTLTPPPVKEAALFAGLTVLQPTRVRNQEAVAELMDFKPDVLVTAAYGQLLPKQVLDIPRIGSLNVHASLLPKWRGAAPIHRALLAGDRETGITIMEMVKALDAGPIVGIEKTPILDSDDVGTLHDRLAEIGANLLTHLLPDYLRGEIPTLEQDELGVTYAERIIREDEFLDFGLDVVKVFNHVRGLSPWPGATAKYGEHFMKLWKAQVYDDKITGAIGQVEQAQTNDIVVQCKNGRLQLLEVQPSGKRKMSADEWYRGSNQSICLERVHTE